MSCVNLLNSFTFVRPSVGPVSGVHSARVSVQCQTGSCARSAGSHAAMPHQDTCEGGGHELRSSQEFGFGGLGTSGLLNTHYSSTAGYNRMRITEMKRFNFLSDAR